MGLVKSHGLPSTFEGLIRVQRSVEDVALSMGHGEHYRSKRSIEDFFSLRCIKSCSKDLTQNMADLGFDQSPGNGLVNSRLFENSVFDDYCQAGLEGMECVDECLEGKTSYMTGLIRRNMDVAFRGLKFLCLEHKQDFRDSITCYRTAAAPVEEVCEPKCGDVKELTDQAQEEIQKAAARKDLNKMSKILEKLCRLLRCQMKCESKVLISECGETESAQLLHDFALISLRSVEELVETIPGATEYWPPTCRRITSPYRAPKL